MIEIKAILCNSLIVHHFLNILQHICQGSLTEEMCAKSMRGKDIYLSSKKSKATLEYTQPPLKWVPGIFYWGKVIEE
jgi:hypothetical protein